MKTNGSKRDRNRILTATTALCFMMIVIGMMPVTHAYSPGATPAGSRLSEIRAQIVGVPTSQDPFGGYAFPNQTSAMPPNVQFLIFSNGASSVQVSWAGNPSAINEQFNWNITIPYVFSQATYQVEITVTSQPLQTSLTFTYSIQVMNYTTYITYENRHAPPTAQGEIPWWVQYEAAEVGVTLGIILTILAVINSTITHENNEKKKKLFEVS